MDEHIAAYLKRIAPDQKSAEWHQRSLKRTLSDWRSEHPAWHDVLVTQKSAGGAVGYEIFTGDIGQYGYDTEFEFRPNLDPHLIDDVENAEGIAEAFYERWVEHLIDVITEDQEASMFTPKELAALYANRDPNEFERRAADALSISVGTYRGKVGRVKNKLEEARASIELAEAAPDGSGDPDQARYAAPLSVIDRVDADQLPVDAIFNVQGIDIQDVPVDQLLRE